MFVDHFVHQLRNDWRIYTQLDAEMVNKAWRIIPRPIMETVLNNHAHRHRVHQPLILHGPRGVGKTTLILERNNPYEFWFDIWHVQLFIVVIHEFCLIAIQGISRTGTRGLMSPVTSTSHNQLKRTTHTMVIRFHGHLGLIANHHFSPPFGPNSSNV